ncbi:hypothetical protein [Methylobacterium sp. WL19]|uniref:hypothetical protein n=1 Tax=Methylobacterium sp. WL19 TaxID=2603896 RepID=UPI0011CB8102|nr:hypothetical protein [Methylobacterium sp. WL19]TXN22774.1 hypothetical protein FV220_21665 [Methylobacterium sp. WL19]
MKSRSLWQSAFFALAAVCSNLSTLVEAADGPYAVTRGSYKFLARDEPLVATDRKVDLWGEVYRPTKLGKTPLPLIVFLHGNHGTCGRYDSSIEVRVDDSADYTDQGKCPPGYVVTPNHLGYTYLAEEMASWGYMVVSINANRGITAGSGLDGDDGLNLMRGRLVLRHLKLLSDWTTGVGQIVPPTTLRFNPKGTMDLSQVGMMGHSRGGEGIRAALQQYRDKGSSFSSLIKNLEIKSLFEIGPVDGQTSRVLDADGVNSMVLLPSCDGDVSTLQGMKVFDRVFFNKTDKIKAFHGSIYAWGANHNAYNTEWQESDSRDCYGADEIYPQNGRSRPQQLTAVQTLVPFFRGTVGANADPSLAAIFNPSNSLPSSLTDITNVDRGFLPQPIGPDVERLETFSRDTGTSDAGVRTTSKGVTVVHQSAAFEHQAGTRVATVGWDAQSKGIKMFQINFAPGKDFSPFKAISFRTSLRCFGQICLNPASENGEMSYLVRLVDANDQLSQGFLTSKEVRISRPVGPTNYRGAKQLHSTLYTINISLSQFGGVDLSNIKGLRFVFNGQEAGTVDIADLVLLKNDPDTSDNKTDAVASVAGKRMMTDPFKAQFASLAPASPSDDQNTIKILRNPKISASAAQAGADKSANQGGVDIVLTSKRSFPFTDAFPKLLIGEKTIEGGTIGPDGKTITIRIPEATFNALPAGADVSLLLLASSPPWSFGPLPK